MTADSPDGHPQTNSGPHAPDNGAAGRSAPADLARSLAATLPQRELHQVVEQLHAQEARLRAQRYEATLARGLDAAARGELGLAREEAQAALRIDFIRWEGHRLLGEIAERSGDRASALRSYVTAIHIGWDGAEAKAALRRLR